MQSLRTGNVKSVPKIRDMATKTYVSNFKMSDNDNLEVKFKKVDGIKEQIDKNNQSLDESLILAQDLKVAVGDLVDLLKSSQKAREKLAAKRKREKEKFRNEQINKSILGHFLTCDHVKF